MYDDVNSTRTQNPSGYLLIYPKEISVRYEVISNQRDSYCQLLTITKSILSYGNDSFVSINASFELRETFFFPNGNMVFFEARKFLNKSCVHTQN